MAEANEALDQEFELEGMRALTEVMRVARIVAMFEPHFLFQVGFPDKHEDLIRDLQATYTNNIPSVRVDIDEATSIATDVIEEFQLSKVVPAFAEACQVLLPRYERALEELQEAAQEDEPDYDEYRPTKETDLFPDSMIDSVLQDI